MSLMATNNETLRVKSVNIHLLKWVLLEEHVTASFRQCEMLEIAINDRKKSYNSKVEVLMSVVESLLTDCLSRVSPEITSLLFDYLFKHTLALIFHGDWGGNKAVKSHMQLLFKRFKFRAERKELTRVIDRINYLLELIENDPWGNAFKTIFSKDEMDEKLLDFLKRELGIVLSVRLEIMIYARCEIQALSLIEKCLHCFSNPSNVTYFQSFPDEVVNLTYLYLLLLSKAKGNPCARDKILNIVNKIGLKGCIQFLNRCQNGELPYEITSKMSVDVVLNLALATAITKEDTDESSLEELIKLWSQSLPESQDLFRLLRHMVLNAVCSKYIYSFGKILIERFKLSEKEMCVEIYVRGLTLNLNEIEKWKTNDDQDKITEYRIQLSNGFLQLGDYLKEDVLLHREFVLAAFSNYPSESCLERIKVLHGNNNPFFEKKNIDEKRLSHINQDEYVLSDIDKGRAIEVEQCDLNLLPTVLAENYFGLPDCINFIEDKYSCKGKSLFMNAEKPLVNDTVTTETSGARSLVNDTVTIETSGVQPLVNDTVTTEMSGARPLVNDTVATETSGARPLVNDTVATETSGALMEQAQQKKQHFFENHMSGDEMLEELTHCESLEGILNPASKGKISKVGIDGSENNTNASENNTNAGCAVSEPLRSIQVYNAEATGISQILCDDLSTLVNSVRNKDLSWDLEWPELIRRCETICILQRKKGKCAKIRFEFHNSDCNASKKKQESGLCHEDIGISSVPAFNLEMETPFKCLKRKRKPSFKVRENCNN